MLKDINGDTVRILGVIGWTRRFWQKEKMLRVYANHRSGSNLFAALLHNNPAVFSINSGGGNKRRSKDFDYALKYSIYPRADLYKSPDKIKYYLLDELKPLDIGLINQLTVQIDHYVMGNRTIVCFRNPFGVLASMQKFHEKYNRPSWIISEENAVREITTFKALINFAKIGKVFPVFMDKFVLDIDDYLRRICEFIGVDYFPDMGNFSKVFASSRSRAEGRFVEGVSDLIIGGFFQNIKLDKEEKVYVCDVTKEPALGFGGFNPHKNIAPERFLSWREGITDEQFELIRSVSSRILSEEATNLLCDTNVGEIVNESDLFRLI